MAPATALASSPASAIDAARPPATSPAPASVVATAASRCLLLAGARAPGRLVVALDRRCLKPRPWPRVRLHG
jgi:hypothetical protein